MSKNNDTNTGEDQSSVKLTGAFNQQDLANTYTFLCRATVPGDSSHVHARLKSLLHTAYSDKDAYATAEELEALMSFLREVNLKGSEAPAMVRLMQLWHAMIPQESTPPAGQTPASPPKPPAKKAATRRTAKKATKKK